MDAASSSGIGTYWLDLFTYKTWNEFLAAGGNVSGFSKGRWTTVQKMEPGDKLLCYLTGVSRFIGVLKVTGEPFQSETSIWEGQTFPSRVPVRVLHKLDAETAVPVLDLQNDLSVFQNLSNPNYWSGAFRGSPAKWNPSDGEIVVDAVAERSSTRSVVRSTEPNSAIGRRHSRPRSARSRFPLRRRRGADPDGAWRRDLVHR